MTLVHDFGLVKSLNSGVCKEDLKKTDGLTHGKKTTERFLVFLIRPRRVILETITLKIRKEVIFKMYYFRK